MKEKQILKALGQAADVYIQEAEPVNKINADTVKKTNRFGKWMAVAACFVLVAVIGAGAFRLGWLGTKTEKVTLENGETITFVRGELSTGSLDMDATVRELTEEELKQLFGSLPVTAFAFFDTKKHTFLGLEGNIGEVKLVMHLSGIAFRDCIIEGVEQVSTVRGIPVKAGYFLTDANSKGSRTAIYYAEFTLGGHTFYVEHAGSENESERVRKELAEAIWMLIENGEVETRWMEGQSVWIVSPQRSVV